VPHWPREGSPGLREGSYRVAYMVSELHEATIASESASSEGATTTPLSQVLKQRASCHLLTPIARQVARAILDKSPSHPGRTVRRLVIEAAYPV
jgi:hypothetical protein